MLNIYKIGILVNSEIDIDQTLTGLVKSLALPVCSQLKPDLTKLTTLADSHFFRYRMMRAIPLTTWTVVVLSNSKLEYDSVERYFTGLVKYSASIG
jgi:hypothetical protein